MLLFICESCSSMMFVLHSQQIFGSIPGHSYDGITHNRCYSAPVRQHKKILLCVWQGDFCTTGGNVNYIHYKLHMVSLQTKLQLGLAESVIYGMALIQIKSMWMLGVDTNSSLELFIIHQPGTLFSAPGETQ